MDHDQACPAGNAWLAIIQRASQKSFAGAFTKDVILDASVATASIVGAVAIRAFFDVTRGMYEQIAFVHETSLGSRTHLEWEGRFAGRPIAGSTILTRDANGAIESIRLYHRPYEQVISFAAELARRLPSNPDGAGLRVATRPSLNS